MAEDLDDNVDAPAASTANQPMEWGDRDSALAMTAAFLKQKLPQENRPMVDVLIQLAMRPEGSQLDHEMKVIEPPPS